MNDWLDLDLPPAPAWEHPGPPRLSWEQHVAFVDEACEMLAKRGALREMLGDFAETHRGEPFVLLDTDSDRH